jgi:DNA-binding transcriptional ArsR family regulator
MSDPGTASAPPPRDVLTIARPEQLKALGHPLRLRVLEILEPQEEALTNRELALRLNVDPGHLHFHVRMLLNAGLIELAPGGKGREKPYRAVYRHLRVAPELLATRAASDTLAAMLEQTQRVYMQFAPTGRFRTAQLNVRLDPESIRRLFREMVARAEELEDESQEPVLMTLFAHPHPAPADDEQSC